MKSGTVSNMWDEKIVQPLLVNTSEISLATECVGMILKIGKSYPISYLYYMLCFNDVLLCVLDDLVPVR